MWNSLKENIKYEQFLGSQQLAIVRKLIFRSQKNHWRERMEGAHTGVEQRGRPLFGHDKPRNLTALALRRGHFHQKSEI